MWKGAKITAAILAVAAVAALIFMMAVARQRVEANNTIFLRATHLPAHATVPLGKQLCLVSRSDRELPLDDPNALGPMYVSTEGNRLALLPANSWLEGASWLLPDGPDGPGGFFLVSKCFHPFIPGRVTVTAIVSLPTADGGVRINGGEVEVTVE